jgi:hypothetical protein
MIALQVYRDRPENNVIQLQFCTMHWLRHINKKANSGNLTLGAELNDKVAYGKSRECLVGKLEYEIARYLERDGLLLPAKTTKRGRSGVSAILTLGTAR